MKTDNEHGKPASIQEIQEAITKLTDEELIKLRKTAQFYVNRLRKFPFEYDDNDLLQQAIYLTLSGDRKWYSSRVNLFLYLHGVMKSIVSHWKDAKKNRMLKFESGSNSSDDGDIGVNPIENYPAENSDCLDRVIVKQEHDLMRQKLESRELALMIFDGMAEGMSSKEIRELGMTQQEYESEMKWIRRTLRKGKIKAGNNG